MIIEIKQGDILAEQADMLICSANVYLNLSGGVGGEILRRYGNAMQLALHQHLSQLKVKHVPQGTVVRTDGYKTGFTHVLHAVAVDGWYQSSSKIIHEILITSFKMAKEVDAKNIALVALATGFGRLGMKDFAMGLRDAVNDLGHKTNIERVCVVVPKSDDVHTITTVMNQQ